MVKDRVTSYWGMCAGIAVAFVLLAMGGTAPAVANAVQSAGIVVDPATPDADGDDPVREPTPSGEEPPDGVEGEGPETVPPTATPGGETGGEALAPGTVTVVVWTSDQGPLPERALVCIGAVCQSVSGSRSGIDLWFDRVEKGWQQVVVQVGAPYGGTTMDVEVRPGSNSRVELTLVVTQPVPGEKLDPTPPPVSAEGPLRTPLQLDPTTTSPAGSVSAISSTNASTIPSTNVSALPSTGIPPDSPSRALVLILGTIAGLLVVAATTVRRVHQA